MKKISLLISAVLVCIMLVFTSCSEQSKAMNYFNGDFKESAVYTTSRQITSVAGELVGFENGIAVFRDAKSKAEKFYVYDIKNDTVLFEYTKEADDDTYIEAETVKNNEDIAVIIRYRKANSIGDVKKAELYQGSNLIASFEGDKQIYYNSDVVVFGSEAYRFDDSELKKAFDIPEYKKIPEKLDTVNDKYLYIYNEDNSVSVLDKSYNLVTNYYPPQADSTLAFVLDNGNIFCRFVTLLPDDASDYTVYDYAEKLGVPGESEGKIKADIRYEIYDVSSEESSEVKLDYLISAVLPRFLYTSSDEIIFNDKADNIAVGQKIINNTVSDDEEILAVNDKLKIKADLNSIIKNSSATLLTDKTWMLKDSNNYIRIINDNAKIIAEFYASSDIAANEKYIITSSCIYDFEMNKLFDFGAEGYTYCGKTSKTVILSKGSDLSIEYFVYNGSTVGISDENLSNELVTVSDSYFTVQSIGDNGPQNQYYNDSGDVIQTTKSGNIADKIYEYEDCALLVSTDDNENITYYRFGQ